MNKRFVCNYLVVFSFLVMGLNDHLLKFIYPSWITGKLSDFSGIIVFTSFLLFFFSKYRVLVFLFSVLFFTFWKSSYSDSFIFFINKFWFWEISRVVDFSDCLAFLILPLLYHFYFGFSQIWKSWAFSLKPILILIPGMFLIASTAPPPSYYYTPTSGKVRCYNCSVNLQLSQNEILDILEREGIVPDSIADLNKSLSKDFAFIKDQTINYYQFDNVFEIDQRISYLDLTMVNTGDQCNTVVYLNGFTFKTNLDSIESEKELRKLGFKVFKRFLRQF